MDASSIPRGRPALAVVSLFLCPYAFAVDLPASQPLVLAQADTSSAPGQLEVDPEAAERALERSLVRTGALLLPRGLIEIEPAFSYTRFERDTPAVLQVDSEQVVARQNLNNNILQANATLRVGLPLEAQLEIVVPFRYVDQQVISETGITTQTASSATGSGAGDVRVGLAKALMQEGVSRPSLVGRVTWDTDTGKANDGQVPLGRFGGNEIEASLTATKRQDPLVFLGSLSYRWSLDEINGVEFGDQVALSLGAVLAASPYTSLRLVLDQTYENEFALNGRTVAGSDSVISSLQFGASSVVGAGKFLDFTVQTGLTDAAPDYSVGIALGIRFNAFGGR